MDLLSGLTGGGGGRNESAGNTGVGGSGRGASGANSGTGNSGGGGDWQPVAALLGLGIVLLVVVSMIFKSGK